MTTKENCSCSKKELETEIIEVLVAISVVAKQLARKLAAITEKGDDPNERSSNDD